jgi:glycerol dehydrogenase
MFKKAVFPGRYIQGGGAIGELPAMLRLLGSRGLLLASPSVVGKVLPRCGLDLKALEINTEVFRGECCEDELKRLSAVMLNEGADVMIGMGGGKVIDTAKIAADRANMPVIIVPTIASSDAPCSGCAVVYSKDGIFQKVYYQKSNPAAVLVDLNIIVEAPTRFLVAGMGDALSTWFEARSCERTGSKNECGGHATAAALRIAELCFETLLTYGAEAKEANEKHMVTEAFDRIVEANTLLSGVGFESAGLASAHAIHNGLTALEETHAYYHGEKVAFGVLTGLQITDVAGEEVDTVYSFCESVGLPTTLEDIGLENADRDRLMVVAERSCALNQPIHHEGGNITPDRVLEAMLAADTIGKERRGSGHRSL